eukprot:25962-Eustigmatos_ZCMA.PRE.1
MRKPLVPMQTSAWEHMPSAPFTRTAPPAPPQQQQRHAIALSGQNAVLLPPPRAPKRTKPL